MRYHQLQPMFFLSQLFIRKNGEAMSHFRLLLVPDFGLLAPNVQLCMQWLVEDGCKPFFGMYTLLTMWWISLISAQKMRHYYRSSFTARIHTSLHANPFRKSLSYTVLFCCSCKVALWFCRIALTQLGAHWWLRYRRHTFLWRLESIHW